MKILITTDLYLPSVNGVVSSVLVLTDELTRAGHEVEIVALSSTIHSYKQGRVTYIGSISADRIYPEVRLRSRSAREHIAKIIDWKPDIIHSQCEFSTFTVAKKIAKATGAPIVHTYHTVYEDYSHYFIPSTTLAHYAVSGFTQYVSKQVSCMIAPTEKIKKLLSDYKVRCPIEVIPSGIDLSAFKRERTPEEINALKRSLKIPEGNKVLVFVGRIGKEKNISEIIYGLAKLNRTDVTLLLVGDGPYRARLEEELQGVKLSVIFAGMIPHSEIDIYYKAGDIFVSASTSETQGLTYDEALACSLPAICKRDACLDGVIIDGYNGWQFNDSSELIAHLNTVLSDPSLLMQMKRNALESSEKFSSETFGRNILSTYNKVLTEKKNHCEESADV